MRERFWLKNQLEVTRRKPRAEDKIFFAQTLRPLRLCGRKNGQLVTAEDAELRRAK